MKDINNIFKELECEYMIQNSYFDCVYCDNGWYKIIFNCIRDITELDENKNVNITTIKEKFGGLRIYWNFKDLLKEKYTKKEIIFKVIYENFLNTLFRKLKLYKFSKYIRVKKENDIDLIIHKTESKSFKVCEICGFENSITMCFNGWYKTVCSHCWNEWIKK